MRIHTASEGISLAKKIENESANFYNELAQQFPVNRELFQSLANNSEKNIKQILRAYYGVISDALEGSYAFNMDPDDYLLNTSFSDGLSEIDAINQAITMEKCIVKFYSDAAEQSGSLMADIPRALKLTKKRRELHITQLQSLINE